MQTREQAITRTSVIGIIINVFLVIFKALVGFLANSLTIMVDAVNNLTDVMSAVITIGGIKLAHKRADKEHPFGHGRFEYFSSILIALLVFGAGVLSLVESIRKIIHPLQTAYTWVTLLVVFAAIASKIFITVFYRKNGKKYKSDALLASSYDALFDILISISTLIGAVTNMIWSFNIDGYIGVLISVFIVKAGVELIISPLNEVVGARADLDLCRKINSEVCQIDGVMGAYDLVVHNYGPERIIGSVYIEIDASKRADEVQMLCHRIELALRDKYGIDMTIGIYTISDATTEVGQMQRKIKQMVLQYPGIVQAHGIVADPMMRELSLDILVDYRQDTEAIAQQVLDDLQSKYPDYHIKLKKDLDFSVEAENR
ncbi:MAG: cation transporter [Paludibacteraceae bacterium]|nr:cation transporter [Paludibacteraceae bacterium]